MMVFKHKKINYAKPNPKTSRLFYHSGLREAWGLGEGRGLPFWTPDLSLKLHRDLGSGLALRREKSRLGRETISLAN